MTESLRPVPAFDLSGVKRRWSTYHDRGAHDYNDVGCRVLAEHAFRDVPALLDEIERLKRELREAKLPTTDHVQLIYEAARLREALAQIAGMLGVSPLADIARDALEGGNG
jgi:hypothetical protein